MEKQLSVNDYLEYINRNYSISGYPVPGKFYIFGYLFNMNINFSGTDIKEKKFYDFFPNVFVFHVDRRKNIFLGFNLNVIPPRKRKEWIDLIKKYTEDNDTQKLMKLKSLFRISSFAIRQYFMGRVKNLREVPRYDWDELHNIYANSTYESTLLEVSAKYLSLIK